MINIGGTHALAELKTENAPRKFVQLPISDREPLTAVVAIAAGHSHRPPKLLSISSPDFCGSAAIIVLLLLDLALAARCLPLVAIGLEILPPRVVGLLLLLLKLFQLLFHLARISALRSLLDLIFQRLDLLAELLPLDLQAFILIFRHRFASPFKRKRWRIIAC